MVDASKRIPKRFCYFYRKAESIRKFIELSAKKLGWRNENNEYIIWSGKGVNEVKESDTNEIVVRVDKRYFRPNEVDSLLGDSSSAKNLLGWEPKSSLENLIDEMIENDIKESKNKKLSKY